jgi:hypothetical protein
VLSAASGIAVGSLVRRGATLTLGLAGLVWAMLALPQSEAADGFRDIGLRLLRSEMFSPTILTQTLENHAAPYVAPCDTPSQRALLLVEMPLAEAALRSGATAEFDSHIQSVEARARAVLGCAPRQSFVWLLMFDLEVLHGRLDEHSFELLAMSYETSPNEAWISIRRMMIAMPLLPAAPEPVRQKVLFEFQQMVRFGFEGEAARSFLAASPAVRSLLQARIEQLEPPRQKAFADALEKLRA